MNYRNLTKAEITALQNQGCYCETWDKIEVVDKFKTDRIRNTTFAGNIKLGLFEKQVQVDEYLSKPSGLYNSYIRNCIVGDNALISNVLNLVNYDIDANAVIENVGSMIMNPESSFGNGVEIEVYNEGGGRELTIYDRLSAQVAYIMVSYRHDSEMIRALRNIIGKYVASKKSDKGRVGKNSVISNTNIIRNVNISENVSISGALNLENGTISACPEAPVQIGAGVYAKNFIVLSGSKIDSGAVLTNCFVGQGVQMGKQFSAENSALFANCEAFHSEACSLFAGPYTVTHHRSTLLIAGMFSFFNAGSGTNQSNHMYKLGPVHQGILERGSKTGSFSYLLWPSRVGAYTAVIGKHFTNFDTSEFPFSYINEKDGKSILYPGMNLFTVGTSRDSVKWPARDRRKDPEKLDLINFELFNPYTVGKMVKGNALLNQLYEKSAQNQEFVTWKGIKIPRLMLKTATKYYDMGIKVYIGNELMKRIGNISDHKSIDSVIQKLKPQNNGAEGEWSDLSGMLAPAGKIEELLLEIKSGKIESIEQLQNSLAVINTSYKEFAWDWCAKLISNHYHLNLGQISVTDLIKIIDDWKINIVRLNNMILKDAEKEFDQLSKISFGIDGDDDTRDKDFENIRGNYNDNKFVKQLKTDIEGYTKTCEDWKLAVDSW